LTPRVQGAILMVDVASWTHQAAPTMPTLIFALPSWDVK
jgi:hypothetical protein